MASPSKSKPLAPAAVGIRLGSSTLTLAVSRLMDGFDGRPMVVASDSGERTMPTVVAWSTGEWVIGDAVKKKGGPFISLCLFFNVYMDC
jgi:molecular chaperone DnaK (HSP70)